VAGRRFFTLWAVTVARPDGQTAMSAFAAPYSQCVFKDVASTINALQIVAKRGCSHREYPIPSRSAAKARTRLDGSVMGAGW
jgi:hypothetical protein